MPINPIALPPGVGDPQIYPLNHPRILWQNVLQDADSAGPVQGINTVSTDRFDLMVTNNTAERSAFVVDDTSGFVVFEYTFNSAVNFDTFCIGAHNLREYTDVQLRYKPLATDATYTSLKTWVDEPPRKPLIFHTQTPLSGEVLQVRFAYSGTSQIEYNIGFISAGMALQVARPHYNNNVQSRHYESTKTVNIMTERGRLIGRNVYRQGSSVPFELRNVSHYYYATHFQPFVEHAKTSPFFYAWNLLEYPDDVDLCVSDRELRPSLVGQRDLIELSADFRVVI